MNEEGAQMAVVKIHETWTATFQATPEYNFTDSEGKPVKIEAREARTAVCGLAEINDGSGVRVVLEFPKDYTTKIEDGDLLTVECRNFEHLNKPWGVKNVTRHIKAKKV